MSVSLYVCLCLKSKYNICEMNECQGVDRIGVWNSERKIVWIQTEIGIKGINESNHRSESKRFFVRKVKCLCDRHPGYSNHLSTLYISNCRRYHFGQKVAQISFLRPAMDWCGRDAGFWQTLDLWALLTTSRLKAQFEYSFDDCLYVCYNFGTLSLHNLIQLVAAMPMC